MHYVQRYEHLSTSPAFALAYDGFARMLEAGHYIEMGSAPFSPSNPCFVVIDMTTKKATGVLVYEVYEATNTAWILFGCVAKDRNGEGIYDSLFDSLKRRLKEENVLAVHAITSTLNTAMQKVAERQGRVKSGIVYSYDLTQKD